jgi:hypothetical protein
MISNQLLRRGLWSAVVLTVAGGLVLVGVGLTSYSLPATIKVKDFGPASAGATKLLGARCATAPGKNRIVLPALCMNAVIVHVGDVKGLITVPTDVHQVGWYAASATTTASAGSTVIVGHVNYVGQGPGAFSALTRVKSGEKVGVNIAGQGTTYWKVVSLRTYPKLHLTANLFDTSGARYLTLITCGGALRHTSAGWHYTDNIVVRAVPWAPRPTTTTTSPTPTTPPVTVPAA